MKIVPTPGKRLAIQGEIVAVAERWYQVGARRGALETLKAILDGDFEVQTNISGKREIVASVQVLTWIKSLKVSVGNKKRRVPKRTYKLTLKDLEFDDQAQQGTPSACSGLRRFPPANTRLNLGVGPEDG